MQYEAGIDVQGRKRGIPMTILDIAARTENSYSDDGKQSQYESVNSVAVAVAEAWRQLNYQRR